MPISVIDAVIDHPNIKGMKSANWELIKCIERKHPDSDFVCLYSGLDSFDYANQIGIKKNLDGMFSCTPKGMLLGLSHVEPYYDYCSHCNVLYARILEKYGVVLERDNSMAENAECREWFYEKGCLPDFDLRTVNDEDLRKRDGEKGITIIDMKSEDNKYLHRDFHLLGDNALKYCADKFGKDEVVSFLRDYVRFFYAPIVKK
jgi:hypothetical protein